MAPSHAFLSFCSWLVSPVRRAWGSPWEGVAVAAHGLGAEAGEAQLKVLPSQFPWNAVLQCCCQG